MDKETFERNPRDYAIEIAETYGWETVARAFIVSLSYDDIRECLDANELSPRFLNDEDEDCDEDNEDEDFVDEEGEDNYYGEDCSND